MQKTKKYEIYRSLEAGDYRFITIWQVVSDEFAPGKLIDWLMDDAQESRTNEFVSISKERGVIALYDISEQMHESEDIYASINQMLDPVKRFDMSVKNFAEILFKWEELRVSRPEIVLIVIHENNHVSLETDPVIIKQYQDAGYAFDIEKKDKN